ncbi:unnamed protein product, partial [Iphiclides podalirius]
MKTRNKIEDDVSGSDLEMFEMPETVLCVDTICNICYAEFLDDEDLKLHIKQVHLTETSRSRYCQFCSSIFASIEEYASHLCDVHILNIRCCKYCMRAFPHGSDVKKHERKHLGPRSAYSCSSCGSIFNNIIDLKQHEYFQHRESKDGVLLQECYSLLSSFLNISAPAFLQSLDPGDIVKNIDEKETPTKNKASHLSDSSMKLGNIITQRAETKGAGPAIEDDVDLVMCPTGTDPEQTDVEKTVKKAEKVKRKRKTKNKELLYVDLTQENDSDELSEEEPLVQVKRRTRMRQIERLRFPDWHQRSKEMKKNRRKFTCKICKKYCYTYQNYNHHMSLHQTHENKKCIKCPKMFKSKEKLKSHIIKDHSSSKLTETLRNVLERRKNNLHQASIDAQIQADRKSATERFLRTIKKVDTERNGAVAKVTQVVDKLSVKKFIENFTPEANDANTKRGKATIKINNSVTIKPVVAPTKKSPTIKLTRFKPEPQLGAVKLKLPERFKQTPREECNVSIKLVQGQTPRKMNFYSPEHGTEDNPVSYDCEETEPNDYDEGEPVETVIPEVAQEVMLEETEELQKPVNVMHKIVIPNLPQVYKDVHIAHLLPEAPFYKIVKIDEVLKKQETKDEEDPSSQSIKLPDGTTLVNVNPLAHLLAGKHVEPPPKKRYKAKPVDFEKAVAKALLKVTKAPRIRRKSKVNMQSEQ